MVPGRVPENRWNDQGPLHLTRSRFEFNLRGFNPDKV